MDGESQRCHDERALFEAQPVDFQAGMVTLDMLGYDRIRVPESKIELASLLVEVTHVLGTMGHLDMSDEQVQAMIVRGFADEIKRATVRQAAL